VALQSITALINITLSTTSSEIKIESIPSNYRDLIVILAGIPTSNIVSGLMQINGDSASNYFMSGMRGNGSTAVSYTQNTGYGFFDYAGDTLVNSTSLSKIQFMDYSLTDKHKTFLTRQDNASDVTEAMVHRWASNSAISSLRFYWTSGSFAAGSTISVYGRIA
jgi:hypothetical protein